MIGKIIFTVPLSAAVIGMAIALVILPIWAVRDRDWVGGVAAVCMWCFLIGGVLMAMGV